MSTLDVHVFGGKKGESIAVRFPTGQWGVVDCYCEKLDDESTNATATFLRSQHVTELQFVCLTHPHKDHFFGIRQLFEGFRVKQFWYPAAFTKENLVSLIKWRSQTQQARAKFVGGKAKDELESLWARYFVLRDSGAIEPIRLIMGTRVPLCEQQLGVSIDAIAPSFKQAERYDHILAGAFDSHGNVNKSFRHRDPNLISLALSVRYGKTSVVLGGDVDIQGWQDALDSHPVLLSGATLVKVAHHGSGDSFAPNVWRHMTSSGKPEAVIAPYHRYHLPSEPVVDELRQHCSSVYSASTQALRWAKASPAIALAMATGGGQPSRNFAGRCTFRLRDDGKVSQYEFAGAAGAI